MGGRKLGTYLTFADCLRLWLSGRNWSPCELRPEEQFFGRGYHIAVLLYFSSEEQIIKKY